MSRSTRSRTTSSQRRTSTPSTSQAAPETPDADTVSTSDQTPARRRFLGRRTGSEDTALAGAAVYNSRVAAFVKADTVGGRAVERTLYFLGWVLVRIVALLLFFTLAYVFSFNLVPNIVSATQKSTGVALDASGGLLWGVLIAPSAFMILAGLALYFVIVRWLWRKLDAGFQALFGA